MSEDPEDEGREGAKKGPDAFRTISEVAEELGLPQHVLRFWESRFPQIKPVKRGGGRRYYRPNDVDLLRGVKQLLYGEGYTIRGVQRILREQGGRKIAQAAGLAPGDAAEAAPETSARAVPPAGPELWAPQRRAEPQFSPRESDPEGSAGAYSLERTPSSQDNQTTVEPEPAAPRARLTEDQAGRLSAALEELAACRRLLAGRS
ncbi:MerR family transcriptional regulator [Hansschlegelia zhihuaiae]|uniref:MerR family transcriptional regulator n=1 Tax=Hansschlegelia zhihuaiae TaxID=405005 RepID=A0A4Q0MLS7_9HYPH|nr:MerR family transcriptional regulator [Hansschlegelia zhihuaiae]RXF74668.1 MerR family transcriptional regulator [Hansschlegelia zhihuaiae]